MKKLISAWFFCLLAAMSLCLAGCEKTEVEDPDDPDDPNIENPDEPTPPQENALTFELSNVVVSQFSAAYTITPSDNTATYLTSVVRSNVIEGGEFEEDGKVYEISGLEDFIDALVDYRSSYNHLDDIIYTGSKNISYSEYGLVPGAEYVVFAVGFDKSTKSYTSEIFSDTFTLDPLAEPIFDITITEGSVTQSSAHVVVKANENNKGMKYFFTLGKADDISTFKSLLNYLEYVIDEELIPTVGSNGITMDDYLSVQGNASTESAIYNYRLLAGTEYYVVAAGVDSNGNIYTDVTYETFTTKELTPSANQFYIDDRKGLIVISTTNDDPYMLKVFKAEELEGLSNEDIANKVVGAYGEISKNTLYFGDTEFPFAETVDSFGDYVAVVFGYNGGITTDITVYEYTFDEVDRSKYTNLSGNFSMEADEWEAYIYMANWGDFYKNGGYNWEISIYWGGQNGDDNQFFTEIVTSDNKMLEGSYDIDMDGLFTYPVGKAYGGVLYNNVPYGTWIICYDHIDETKNEWVVYEAAADSGTVAMSYWEEYGDYIYSFDVEYVDPAGNTVTVKVKDGITMYVDESDDFYSFDVVNAERPVTTKTGICNFSISTKLQLREKMQKEARARFEAHKALVKNNAKR